MLKKLLEAVDLEALSTNIVGYLPNLVGAVVLIGVFWGIAVVLRKGISAGLNRSRIPADAKALILRLVRYVVVIIAFLTIADQLGVDITSLVAGLGIAGLALSFAAQDTIANVISGVAILIDRPFKQGDMISLGDLNARVGEIRLRTTVLTTFDNETVVVPNKELAQQRVVNYTLTPTIRVRVPVGIAYKEDTGTARDVLLSVVSGDSRILPEPAPSVVVKSLGDSSVNLELRFWTLDAKDKFPLTWEYTEKCKRALDEAGIQIPFPHLQLFLEQSDGVAALVGSRQLPAARSGNGLQR